MVFIDELIDTVEQKLNTLICIYCEKVFKDRTTLKEHMRKKGHKRINPDNKLYDKFFLINYKGKDNSPAHHRGSGSGTQNTTINPRRTKPSHAVSDSERKKKPPQERSRVFQTDNSDSDWSEWTDEEIAIVCLFCDFTSGKIESVKEHMRQTHLFDFDCVVESLNFYQRVKMVNFIRRQMLQKRCVNDCCIEFNSEENLLKHMMAEKHFVISDTKLYNQPQYFFPTVDGKMIEKGVNKT